jgi:GTP cyclohydrolase I
VNTHLHAYTPAGNGHRPEGLANWPGISDADDDLEHDSSHELPPDAEAAAAAFLRALGLHLDNDGMRETPARMARTYRELFTPAPFTFSTFDNDDGYDELVLARDIPMRSVCEHHLLPFVGVAHVAYLPGARIAGLSKLARAVAHFGARPQVQERMTTQIADFIEEQLAPRGVGVVLNAEHSCMTVRGVRALGTRTVTSAVRGRLREDGRSRAEFFSLTQTS